MSVRYEQFDEAFHERLRHDGWTPVSERFPLAGHELGMLRFDALQLSKAGRSFVVATAKGDGLVSEQLRYLSDQFYNALVRETNEIRQRPTLIRGTCVFAYEKSPDPRVSGFLMERVRPRTPFTPIRSVPWVFDMSTGKVARPILTRAPFPEGLLRECVERAGSGTVSGAGRK